MYLQNHTPDYPSIKKWKGIDIVYFQEDLQKASKGTISEKSFYTYFKNDPKKTPRIDVLNILSIYAGYKSWNDFKSKIALPAIPQEQATPTNGVNISEGSTSTPEEKEIPKPELTAIQTKPAQLELVPVVATPQTVTPEPTGQSTVSFHQDLIQNKKVWAYISAGVVALAVLLGWFFWPKHYTYCFTDADRNAILKAPVYIEVIREKESPIYYTIPAGECLVISPEHDVLRMNVSSPLYEKQTIIRNLENAPEEETVSLKPDDYKMAVFYFSKKNISGDAEQAIEQKRKELDRLISNDAIIYQVYDSDIYGVETMNKSKYITLVTTPTTALKNLNVIEMKKDKGKIVSIKFKIAHEE